MNKTADTGHQQPAHVTSEITTRCKNNYGAVSVRLEFLDLTFFEDPIGQTVTVTSQRYVVLLQEFLQDELRRRRAYIRLIWFQQDGATAHIARESMRVDREMFLQHVLSRDGDIAWPPRSPDLSLCDFLLWSYLKEKVFVHRPHTIQELKDCIREEIHSIPQSMLKKVTDNIRVRAEICPRSNGAHLSDIIFKK